MKANVRLEHRLIAVESENKVHAMLELVAPAAPAGKPRPPMHLAIVIDRSGSMHGAKLENTKRAAEYLVRRMVPTDEVAIVTYDGGVQLVSSLSAVHPERLIPVLRRIRPGGTTNLSGGWLKGLEEVKRANDDGPRKILLLTDGLANQGITDRPTLVGMSENARGSGIGTTTIGFGAGFDEELLTAMAAAGGGNSHFAGSPEDAPRIFAEEFDDLSQLVAQNVSAEIRPTEHANVVGILNEYPHSRVVGGIQAQLGDAYGEENRRIVFELLVPRLAALGVVKIADVIVRYVSVGDEIASHEITIPLLINLVSANEAAAEGPDGEVTEEILILKAAHAQREARRLADSGEYAAAQNELLSVVEDLRAHAPNSNRGAELLREAGLLEQSHALANEANWNARASKAVHYDAWRKARGRRRPHRPPEDRL